MVASSGSITDDLIHRGLDAINDQDFRPWLAKYAFPDGDLMMNSPVVRSVYDSSFSYENGDTTIPPGATFPPAAKYEAGTVLRGIIRGLFTYRGSLTYRFAAGTGDSCYVPMYQVLKRRGVKFKFFHRVEELRPGVGPGRPIDRITIARQVDLRAAPAGPAAEYDPLIVIKGLPCWPHRPRFEQLVGGDELARDWKDLEDPPADFRDAGREELQLGRDFDVVVLGIPVGAHHAICAPLVAQSGHWRQMIERVKTVRTQALQTWAECSAAGLGWALPGQDIASVLWEYDRESLLNVWGDLTEVAKWEGWPSGRGAGQHRLLLRADARRSAAGRRRCAARARDGGQRAGQGAAGGAELAVERRRRHVEERVPAGRGPARVSLGAAGRPPPRRAARRRGARRRAVLPRQRVGQRAVRAVGAGQQPVPVAGE